jgi:hypothetical protein
MYDLKLLLPSLPTIVLKTGKLTTGKLNVAMSTAASKATSGTLTYTRVIDGLSIYYTESLVFDASGTGQ